MLQDDDDDEEESFLSQAQAGQPSSRKRRRTAVKLAALNASHVRLFGDGVNVAPLKRGIVSATKSPWWTGVRGFEQYLTKDSELAKLRVCVDCASLGKDDAEINCGKDASPQGVKQHMRHKHKAEYAELLSKPNNQGLYAHGFATKDRPWMEDLVIWIVMENLPLSSVETPYFRRFLQ